MKRLLMQMLGMITIFVIPACTNDLPELTQGALETKSEKIKQAFSEELVINLENSFKTGVLKSNTSLYPDYYGGNYIENGNLVILVTGDTLENKEKMSARTQSSDFIIKQCQFSFNELLSVHEAISNFFQNRDNDPVIEEITMTAFGIKPSDNSIFVDLKDCAPEKIALFKSRVIDSPIVSFHSWNGPIIAQADIVPGGHVSLSSTGLPGGSTGYRAKMGTIKGVVCSGHVLSSKGGKVYRNGIVIGTVKHFIVSGDVDAAFVELNSGYEGTNSIGGTSISTSIEVMGEGGLISLRGHKNQSDGSVVATGVVCDVTIQSTGQTVRLTNCTRCKYTSEGGDSGGLIYSTNRKNTVGIHEGADTSFKYYVLAHSVNDALGLVRY